MQEFVSNAVSNYEGMELERLTDQEQFNYYWDLYQMVGAVLACLPDDFIVPDNITNEEYHLVSSVINQTEALLDTLAALCSRYEGEE